MVVNNDGEYLGIHVIPCYDRIDGWVVGGGWWVVGGGWWVVGGVGGGWCGCVGG